MTIKTCIYRAWGNGSVGKMLATQTKGSRFGSLEPSQKTEMVGQTSNCSAVGRMGWGGAEGAEAAKSWEPAPQPLWLRQQIPAWDHASHTHTKGKILNMNLWVCMCTHTVQTFCSVWLCLYLSVCLCTMCIPGGQRGLDPWNWRSSMWVLGAEPRSSGRAVASSHWAISLATPCPTLKGTISSSRIQMHTF